MEEAPPGIPVSGRVLVPRSWLVVHAVARVVQAPTAALCSSLGRCRAAASSMNRLPRRPAVAVTPRRRRCWRADPACLLLLLLLLWRAHGDDAEVASTVLPALPPPVAAGPSATSWLPLGRRGRDKATGSCLAARSSGRSSVMVQRCKGTEVVFSARAAGGALPGGGVR